MITFDRLQAYSASLNEGAVLRERRMRAFEMLQNNQDKKMTLPDIVSVEDGLDMAYKTDSGVICSDFAVTDVKERARLEEVFGTVVTGDDALLQRHHAFRTSGMYFRIPPGMTLDQPISLQCKNVVQWAGTHIVLIVGAGSQVTFVEQLTNDGGGDAAGTWSHVAEVIVEDDAQVEYVSLQTADPAVTIAMRHGARVGKGASIAWRNATIGGKDVRHDLRSTLTGDNARSSVDWIAYAKGAESQRLSARNEFRAGNGGGEITMKGVAEGKAFIACNGMIDIGPQGRGTDTYLTEDVLMLDRTARVDAIPGLMILTNDVKASHSATVSRVTEEDLFYFGARGIAPVIARRMYIEGFLGDLTGRVTVEEVRMKVLEGIEGKYGRGL